MRIALDLQACQTASRQRGIGRYALSMARALIESGSDRHEFFVILTSQYPAEAIEIRKTLSDVLVQERIVVVSSPGGIARAQSGNAWRAKAAQALYDDAMRTLAIDLVFCPSPFENMKADVVVPSAKTVPFFATVHDLIPLTAPDIYLADDAERKAYFGQLAALRQADGLIAVSAFTKAETERRLGVEPYKITHAALGAADVFRPFSGPAETRDAILAKYGVKDRFVIVTAPYEERKNIHGMLAAYAAVDAAARANLQIVFAGFIREDSRTKILKMAREEGLGADEVLLAGYVPDEDLAALYSFCDLMVFPSLSEGFGLPPLEAMACGAIVIGSNTTSIPEVINHREAQFDPADTDDMAAVIQTALTSSTLRSRLAAWGKKRAAEFSWDKSARLVLQAFEASTLRPPPAVQGPSSDRQRIGVMAFTEYPEGRQAGVLGRLLQDLAARHEVFLCLRGEAPFDPLIGTSAELCSEDWIEQQGGSLDAMIYVADARRIHEFARWHASRPGVFILYDDVLSDADTASGNTIPGELQTALYETSGFAGLIDHMDQGGRARRYGAGQSLVGSGATVLVNDGDSVAKGLKVVRTPPRTALIPIGPGEALRRHFAIPPGARVVLASATDRTTAGLVVQAFRSLREKDVYLLLGFDDEAGNVLPVGEDPDRIGSVVGRIIRVGSEIRRRYGAFMAAASVVVVAGETADPTSRGLAIDARHLGKPLILAPEDAGSSDGAVVLSTTALAEALSAALKPVNLTIEATYARQGTAAFDDQPAKTGKALRTLLSAAPRPAPYLALASALPNQVADTFPDVADISRVVQCVAANAALVRTPKAFIDISALASPGVEGRLDSLVHQLLKALLMLGGSALDAVYFDGTRYVLARRYLSRILGVRNPVLNDEAIHFRSGDRLFAVDVVGLFPQTRSTLLDAQARGVVLAQISTSRILSLRPDLIDSTAAAIWESLGSLGDSTDAKVHRARGASSTDTTTPAPDAPLEGSGPDVQLVILGDTDARWPIDPTFVAAPVVEDLDGPSVARLGALLSASPAVAQENITVMGHILGSYSLAIVNRTIARVLEDYLPGRVLFSPFETLPVTDLSDMPDDERPTMQALVDNALPAGARNVVISQHYPLMPPPEDAALGMALFAWEETHVPPETVDLLNEKFDVVLGQVRSVRKALIDSGVHRPIPLVGLPVDVSHYRGLKRTPPKDVTTFLHVSSCFPRKGVDILLAAWGEAFTAADRVKLVIKTFPNPHNDVEDQIRALRAKYADCAEIEVINRDMDKEELASLYETASVMVLPTRGEGYNLPALEAMIAGVPLIVTAYGGHRDFCGYNEARLLDYQFEKSGSHVRKGISLWTPPHRDDLVAAMREQADPAFATEIEARRRRAIIRAEAAIEPEAWVRRVRGAIDSVTTRPSIPVPRTGWVTTWAVKCGVAQYSNFIIERLPADTLANTVVLSDARTAAGVSGPAPHLPAWTLGRHQKVEQLLQTIESQKLDAIVFQHQDGLITWPDLANILNDPRVYERIVVVTLHIAGNLNRLLDYELRAVIEGLHKCARVLVHNVDDLNLLKTFGVVDNAAVLPHGAIAQDTAPAVRNLDANSTPVIGSHGFFFEHKGLEKLIRAAAILRQDWPNLRVRLVNARFPGGASDAAILAAKAAAEETGMTDAVDWHLDFMAVDEIQDLLLSCDVLALPYDESDDSASGAVRVAMSTLVPLVVSDVKIFAEIGDAVVKSPSNDPAAMAMAMGELLGSPERRTQVQQSMKSWLEAHDWRRIASTMDGMLKGLMDAKARGWAD